ncbi:MAG TPA: YbaK/EbsC family protein [Anaerolineales bacterium]|nr:YbaK/EbsC family protein [Anaerolineales bacterium]
MNSYLFEMHPDPIPLHTPITRLLDTHHVPYRRLPHQEAVFTIETAAQTRGVVMEEMVKSILLKEKAGTNTRYVMACVPGHARLLPQNVREYLPGEWRRLTFASAEEIQAVTGAVKGAVAPLCLPDDVSVVFDEALLKFDKVSISSGDPWLGLEIHPADLFRLAKGVAGQISEI